MFLGPTAAEAEAAKEKRRLQREWLENQVKEKERRVKQQKALEQQREEKIRKEAAGYNPWGRGGAGAPLRGNDGNVLTNMKQILNGGVAAKADPLRMEAEPDEPPPAMDVGERSVPASRPLPVEERSMDPRALARAATAKVSPVVPGPSSRIGDISPSHEYAKAKGGKRSYEGALARVHADPEQLRAKAEKRAQLVKDLEEQVRQKKEREQARKNREKEDERVEHERMMREVPFGDAPSPRKTHDAPKAPGSPGNPRNRAGSARHGNNLAARRGLASQPEVRIVEPDVSEIPGLGGAPEAHISPIASAAASAIARAKSAVVRDDGGPGFDIKRYVSQPEMSLVDMKVSVAGEHDRASTPPHVHAPRDIDPAATPPHVRAAHGRGFTPSPSPPRSRASRKSDSHVGRTGRSPVSTRNRPPRRETVAGHGSRRPSKQEERTISALANVETRLRAAEQARDMLSVRGNGGDALEELAVLCRELVSEQRALRSALAEQNGVVGQLVKSGLINGLVSDNLSDDGSDLPPVRQAKRRPTKHGRARGASHGDGELSLPPLGSKERREGGVRMHDKRRSVRIVDDSDHSPAKPPKARKGDPARDMKERKHSMEKDKKKKRGPPKPTVPRKPKPRNIEERAAARRARIAARSAMKMDKVDKMDKMDTESGEVLSRKPSRIPRSAGMRQGPKNSESEGGHDPVSRDRLRRQGSSDRNKSGTPERDGPVFRKRSGIAHGRQGATRSAREKRSKSPRVSTESRPKSAGLEAELTCKLLESESTFMFPNDPREQDLYTTDRWVFQMDRRSILNPTPELEIDMTSVEAMAKTIVRAPSPRVVPSAGDTSGFPSLSGPFDAPRTGPQATPPRSPITSPQRAFGSGAPSPHGRRPSGTHTSNQEEPPPRSFERSSKHHRSSTDVGAASNPLPREATGPPPMTADAAQPSAPPLAREESALEIEAEEELPSDCVFERAAPPAGSELPTEPSSGSPHMKQFVSAPAESKLGRKRTKIKVLDPFARR